MSSQATGSQPLRPLPCKTRCAHWGHTEHQYFGHAVFSQLLEHESLMGLNALSVLGRRLTDEQCHVLEEAALTLTMADPRIWPLKLTRVVAAYGRSVPAAAAGILVLQDARIGPWPTVQTSTMLKAFHERWQGRWERQSVHADVRAYLNEHGFLWGFGTPFRTRDERLLAFRPCIERRGLHRYPHFMTFEALCEAAREQCDAPPNILCALAAVLLDMGISCAETGPVVTVLMQHMFLANAVEAAAESPSLLRKLPKERVEYCGPPDRKSPHGLRSATERVR
ncbi:MAG TPA: hypothetical protein VFQ61_26275 [Polyangiaceae bacterium]|nr:hypothetical protein [Polyangiaceae bacterium]